MLFSSFEFIFFFLPIAVVLFYCIRNHSFQLASMFLVLVSFAYYGYWKPEYLILLLGSIGFNFIIAGRQKNADGSRKKTYLISAIIFNLGLLFYFKYAGFTAENLGHLLNQNWNSLNILLPIGISFFTFQQIAYQVDLYKEKIETHRFWDYALFVSFFPQLIAGPIVHHKEMIPQFRRPSARKFYLGNLVVGFSIFVIGLFKKVVIADNLALFSSPVYEQAFLGENIDFYAAWVAALGYTFQLYFDFSGYSDMAVGAARMFGIRMPMNFFSPYKAHNIVDFWRRWHMTLSRFFRDYLYIPLGGNRKGAARQITNLFLTMVLVGIWHGAGWTFVIWGAYHGILLILTHVFSFVSDKKITPFRLLTSFGLTFLLVVFGWVLFRAADLSSAFAIWTGMFGLNGFSLPPQLFFYGFVPDGVNIAVSEVSAKAGVVISGAAFIAFFMPNTYQIFRRFRPVLRADSRLDARLIFNMAWQPTFTWAVVVMALFILALGSLLAGESEFLYYDF